MLKITKSNTQSTPLPLKTVNTTLVLPSPYTPPTLALPAPYPARRMHGGCTERVRRRYLTDT